MEDRIRIFFKQLHKWFILSNGTPDRCDRDIDHYSDRV